MFDAKILAKRYAKALWAAASESNTDAFSKGLEQLSTLLKDNETLRVLAKSPIFSVEEKMKVFVEVFEKLSINKEQTSFLRLMLEKDRFWLLPEVNEAFRQLHLNSQKTKEALVETAFELNKTQLEEVTQVLEAALDTKVKLQVKINEALVAGLVVHVDGRSIDASLRSNLNVLKDELLRAEA